MTITKKDYKERLAKRYQKLSNEEKKKRQCGCENYKNLSEYEKERLVEYRKNTK